MPCYMTGSREGDLELERDELREEATEVTRMLCDVCKRIEAGSHRGLMSKKLEKWWRHHKALDAKHKG